MDYLKIFSKTLINNDDNVYEKMKKIVTIATRALLFINYKNLSLEFVKYNAKKEEEEYNKNIGGK